MKRNDRFKVRISNILNYLEETYLDKSIWNIWGYEINKNKIKEYLSENDLEDYPYSKLIEEGNDIAATSYSHEKRIAYLIKNKDENYIDLDFGVDCLNYIPSWGISDGNHRLLAAIIRGDDEILVDFQGSVNYAMEKLGIKKPIIVNLPKSLSTLSTFI